MSKEPVKLVKVIHLNNGSADKNQNGVNDNSSIDQSTKNSSAKAKGKRTPTKQEILTRLSQFNKFHDKGSPHHKLTYIQDSQGILISGNLRIYWGLKKPIKQALTSAQSLYGSNSHSPLLRRKFIKNPIIDEASRPIPFVDEDLESTFTPQFDSAAAVNATSRTTTPLVIQNLLHKFRIINDPKEFALVIKRIKTGDCRQLNEVECPLLARLMLGPNEENFKIFVCHINDPEPTKNKQKEAIVISQEALQYINFSLTELANIIQMYKKEEEREKQKIKEKYSRQKEILQNYLSNVSTSL